MEILWTLVLGWLPSDTSWQNLWINRWALLVLVSILFTLWRWRNPFYLLLGMLAASATVATFSPAFHGAGEGAQLADQLQLMASHSLAVVLAFAIFMMAPSWGPVYRLDFLRHVAACVVAVAISLSAVMGNNVRLQVPLLSNPSMAGLFIVLAIGTETGIWPVLMVMTTLLQLNTFTPLATWVAMQGWMRFRWRFLYTVPLLVLPLIFWGHWEQVVGEERLSMWRLAWNFIAQSSPWRILFGRGLGTTPIWAPALQYMHESPYPPNLWLHNDWLQLLLELGAVGVTATLATAAYYWGKISDVGRATLLGFGVGMVGDMPLHWAAHGLILWVLVKREFELMKGTVG